MTKRLIIGAIVVFLAVAAYFVISDSPPSRPVQATAPPPPEVGVVIVQAAEVPFPVTYAGRVVGFRDVEVRSVVGGLLLKRGFEEGARVTQSQRLFQIDPRPYEVALKRAEAQLAQAQATLRQAEENFGRAEELFGRGVSTDKAARGGARGARSGTRRCTNSGSRDCQCKAESQLYRHQLANGRHNGARIPCYRHIDSGPANASQPSRRLIPPMSTSRSLTKRARHFAT